jgi:hypothetical protein
MSLEIQTYRTLIYATLNPSTMIEFGDGIIRRSKIGYAWRGADPYTTPSRIRLERSGEQMPISGAILTALPDIRQCQISLVHVTPRLIVPSA